MDELAGFIGENVKALRETRGWTQQQCAALAEMPRPTWALLESGTANPTIASLAKAAAALQVSVQELIEAPTGGSQLFRAASLPRAQRRGVTVSGLLPDGFIGTQIERLVFRPGAAMKGVPHRAGTREYLICDKGSLALSVAGETLALEEGDVVVFRGDQKHGYKNRARGQSVATSVIILDRGRAARR